MERSRYQCKANEGKWKPGSPEFEESAQTHNVFYLQKSTCLIFLSAEKAWKL